MAKSRNNSRRTTEDKAPHLAIIARAGTGKTTTLVEGLNMLRGISPCINPSDQQSDIWDAICRSDSDASVCFVAFNRSIADELKQRVPSDCDAMTMHSMGFAAVRRRFGRVRLERDRVLLLVAAEFGMDIRELRRSPADFDFARLVAKVVGLVKNTLTDPTDHEALDALCVDHQIDLNGNAEAVFDSVEHAIELCKDVDNDGMIDFNDMVWLPVELDLPMRPYDMLLVDEAQDLNRCQQALARKAGHRLVLCGDPKQAIYAFAGADSASMTTMIDTLGDTDRGCLCLPLTVTRRCPSQVVALAQTLVPDFEAHESNGEGIVTQGEYALNGESASRSARNYRDVVADGDMVLCRTNAPLVSECFGLLADGHKATIIGKKIGEGLIALIKKAKTDDPTECIDWLEKWFDRECDKEQRRKLPKEERLINLQDRLDCARMFVSNAQTVADAVFEIEEIFSDENGQGVRLSSIHKAKGLEANRVFLLMPKKAPVPHPMATTASAKEQEHNLLYVAYTRAMAELHVVN